MAEKYKTRGERRQIAESQKKSQKKPKKLLKKIFLVLITIGIIGLLAGGVTFAYFISDAPKLNEKLLKDPIASKIYDKNGNLITEVGQENRDYVYYQDIPELVKDAFIATEDSRFYEHHGVDFLRLGSAVMANFSSGFGSQGASTITQQVVKRTFLSPEKTIKRKVQEMWLSLQLERKYSKDQILEMYVNKIWFANGANGILTAAHTYYGKNLDQLKLNQVAMLVGLPQSPSRYDPYKHPNLAKERRNVVLYLMNKHGYISDAEMKAAQSKSIKDGLKHVDNSRVDTTPYDAFIDEVINEVQKMGDYNIFTDGLQIYTTLDKNAQQYVFKMLNTNQVISYPNQDLQAGITLLDTQTGEIRAIGGGRNTTVKRGWNYATDTKRSPGSTIKPIVDYGPAVEYLNWSTYQQLKDEPYTYSDGTPISNAGGGHYGTVTAREAIGRSLNIPALKTLQTVGLDNAKQFANRLGITFTNNNNIVESSAIGGGVEVSTLDIAGAYSAFGNNGIYNKPHAVKKIVLPDRTEIKNKIVSDPVMKESTAFIVTDMLKSVLNQSYGTGRLANIPGLPVAGKTGSTNFTPEEIAKYNIPSNGVKDSWMAGYTTNYTVAVWAGYKNDSQQNFNYLGSSSQRIPKYLFKNLMQYVSSGQPTSDFKQPSSVVKVGIIKGSNPAVKANKYTPSDKISYEYYVRGYEPTQVTSDYKKLDGPSNLSASYNVDTNEISLSWAYSNSNSKGNAAPQFEVRVSVDGGKENILTHTKNMSLTMKNPTPGSTYTFSVVAIADNQNSDPASASVSIPSKNDTGIIQGPGQNNNTGQTGNQQNQQPANNGTSGQGTSSGGTDTGNTPSSGSQSNGTSSSGTQSGNTTNSTSTKTNKNSTGASKQSISPDPTQNNP